jgi:hypothetical protein
MSRVVLVFAALMLVAGCGDKQKPGQKADYTRQMQQIQQDPGGKVEALGSAMVDPRLDDQRWRRAAHQWLQHQHNALERLREISPPSDVATLHRRYVDATAKWLASMDRLVDAVESERIAQGQLEARATRIGDRYARAVGPVASQIEASGYDVFRPFGSG